jgi:predicted RNA binding protein YcfA (HicA-like mRNA interferase family)
MTVALHVVSGRKMIRILSKIGFRVVGKKGSHVRLKKGDGKTLIVIVPDHGELAKGTLRSIIRKADLTPDDLNRLLK